MADVRIERPPGAPGITYVCTEPGCRWDSGNRDPIEAQYAYLDHLDWHDNQAEADEPTGEPD